MLEDNEEDVDEINESQKNKNKSKKKRKKNKKPHNKKAQDNNEIFEDQVIEDDNCEDEIERTVRQVNKLLGEPMPSISQTTVDDSPFAFVAKTKEQTLCIQHKHLNPYNELKRIFGSKTVQAEKKFVKYCTK